VLLVRIAPDQGSGDAQLPVPEEAVLAHCGALSMVWRATRRGGDPRPWGARHPAGNG
jgi:hypothetical protein